MENIWWVYGGVLLMWVALAIVVVMVLGTRRPAVIPQERIQGKMPIMHGDHDA